jgi:hypothetical protein
MDSLDPLVFGEALWPGVTFYDKQQEIIRSVKRDDETYVPAGNMLGKDFVAGFVALGAFLEPQTFLGGLNPSKIVRVVTTSVKDDHLRVLWGEIGRFIDECKYPLRVEDGGPLIVNHRDIRKVVNGVECKVSYLRGMVSAKGEGMAGHHAPHTLAVIDEASGVDELVYTQMDTWARRKLIIGNPNPCTNFFYRGVKEGDVVAA